MELLIAVLFIVILILVITQKNSYVKESKLLRKEIAALREQVLKINMIPAADKQPPPAAVQEKKETPQPTPPTPLYEKPLQETLFVIPEKPGAGIDTPEEIISAPVQRKPVTVQAPANTKPPVVAKPPKPGFFERHPDLEKFIGENLISKIGIAILVLAIAFFVKYAIDNNWIGSAGRVAIGILCGGILTGLAHKLHKNYHAFSSVLAGGGLAIFYFTITLAYHEYHIFSQTITFIIMLVITTFAVLLSLLYNRQELAVIALVGGFATPFMASNGSGDYITLFIYLIILNTGLLFIAYRKSWRLLNLLAFIFTVILFGSWLATLPDNTLITVYRNGFIFASIFYILFLAINIAHNIRDNRKFVASDFGILLANTCVYFSAGLYMLTQMEAVSYRGLFSAAMGVFNLVLSYILFRNKKVDSNILYLLIGITLTFISLTAPIQLRGNHITLFWSSEAVLLYWLFQKSRIKIIHLSSVIVWIAMIVSLLMDWINIYGDPSFVRPILANKGFITTFYASLACLAVWLLKKKDTEKESGFFAVLPGKNVFLISGCILLYASGALEVNHQFASRYPDTGLNGLYLLLYSMAFVVLFTLVTNRVKLLGQSIYLAVLYGVSIVWYFLFSAEAFNVQYIMLKNKVNQPHFIAHWVSALLFIIIIYRLIQLLRTDKIPGVKKYSTAAWLICIVAVIFISIEGHLLANNLFYSDGDSFGNIRRVYIKAGLPIIWGLCSFILMWLGMNHKYKTLRIISLLLFSLTLIKLFLFDIRNIPVAGKIAAFFCLGVLLLIVSFMYQRLKKMIIEDENVPKTL